MSGKLQNQNSTILIASDDKDFCLKIDDILRETSFKVVRANDFDNAIKIIKTIFPALVIVSVKKFDDFGVVLCRQIKQENVFSIVLQITPEDLINTDGTTKISDCDSDAIFGEPFNNRNFLANIRNLLRFQSKQDVIGRRQAEERYRAFIQNSGEGIWRAEIEKPISTDLPAEEQIKLIYDHGYIAEANDAMAQMYGLTRAENLINTRIKDLFVESDRANHEYLKSFVTSNYRLTEAESHERDANGKDVYFLNNLVGTVENGKLVRAWGTQRDITLQKRAENELRNSESKYRGLVELSGQIIYLRSADGRKVEFVNQKWREYTGLEAEDMARLEREALLHPDDLEQVQKVRNENFVRGEGFNVETRLRGADGEYRWFLTRVLPLKNDAGTIQNWLGMMVDIHESKIAAERLRESEERQRLFTENLNNIFWIFDWQKQQVEYLSPAFERITGVAPENIIGAENKWLQITHPDDVWQSAETFAQIFQTGRYENEYRIIREDGSIRWMLDKGLPLYNSDGNLERVIGVAEDVTETKQINEQINRLNQELQERVTELQTLLELLPIGVSIANNTDFKYVYANNYLTELMQLPTDNISASNETVNEQLQWQFFREGQEFKADDLPLQKAVSSGETIYDDEFDVYFPQRNETISFLGNAAPLFDERGVARGGVGAFVDVTERKQAEREREELIERAQKAQAEAEFANRAKDEFLAVLSHELRTPLNAMHGWARMLASGTLDETMQKRAVEVIERNIALQSKLIEDILDVSRIVSGKIKLETRQLELGNLIKSITEMSRPAAALKQISVETNAPQKSIFVNADAERLQQVFTNLLNNAIKFSPAGGTVIVAVEENDQMAEISVTDTGVGIAAEFLPHVFDRFRQADGSSKRRHGGLGLGLAIVKNLIELHGGSVAAESAGEGKGASFIIQIPLAAADSLKPETNAAAAPPHDNRSDKTDRTLFENMNVCIIEDDLDAAEVLRVMLTAHGARVTHYNLARTALDALKQNSFNLILSDVGLPEMDGAEFIKALRAADDEQIKNLPALAVTAYVSTADTARFLRAGFNACLAKPVSFEALQTTVATLQTTS